MKYTKVINGKLLKIKNIHIKIIYPINYFIFKGLCPQPSKPVLVNLSRKWGVRGV